MGEEKNVQLNNDTVFQVPDAIQAPTHLKSDLVTRIVHIGPSNFFRGHLAAYIHELNESGQTNTGICAVSLKNPRTRDLLKPQDWNYTLVEEGTRAVKPRIITSITDILMAPEDPEAVFARMAHPDVKLVTMTVTQKGYNLTTDGNSLDLNDPDIKESLRNGNDPRSTIGLVVEALDRRRKAGIEPFVVMSCDNMTNNGDRLRHGVLAFAAMRSKELRQWIEENVSFPVTMVDRIVPRSEDKRNEEFQNKYGVQDASPIFCEQFRQFVVTSSPALKNLPFRLEDAGVQVVEDVATHERTKIRLLNGTHMAIGMIGRFRGHTYAHEAIADPQIREFVHGFTSNMIGTLQPQTDPDPHAFVDQVMDRLANPALNDDLSRLSRNGIDKLGSRFFEGLNQAYARDLPRDHLLMATACWALYVQKAGEDMERFKTDLETLDNEGKLSMGWKMYKERLPALEANGKASDELADLLKKEPAPEGLKPFYDIQDPKAHSLGVANLAARMNGDMLPLFSHNAIPWGSLLNDERFTNELNAVYHELKYGDRHFLAAPASHFEYQRDNGHPTRIAPKPTYV